MRSKSVYKISILFFSIILVISISCHAQSNRISHWFFGFNNHFDFSDTANPKLTREGNTYTWGNTATMSDKKGNLLFYTDGETVWNKQHKQMINGTGLHGSAADGQGSIIIPFVGVKYKYYIFTVDGEQNNPIKNIPWKFQHDSSLSYSIVDMRLDDGKGAITVKNIPLLKTVDQTLTAIQHANKRDFWLITKKYATDSFYIYKITECGIESPLIFKGGIVTGLGSIKSCIKPATNGKKISYVMPRGFWFHFIFDFNDTTGVMSNPMLLKSSPSISASWFSSDNNYVYHMDTLNVYRYDLSSNNIPASKKQMFNSANLAGLQIAKNGKIYGNNQLYDSIFVFSNTSSPNFSLKDITMFPTAVSQGQVHPDLGIAKMNPFGFTNAVESYYDPDYKDLPDDSIHVSANNVCVGDSVVFEIFTTRPISSIIWDYGDGNKNQTLSLKYLYNKAGKYNVKLYVRYQCVIDTISITITINKKQQSESKKQVIYKCNKDEIILNATDGFDKYQWNTGFQEQVFKTNEYGVFTVSQSNACGEVVDTVEIKRMTQNIPNIITPNNDGLNEILIIEKNVNIPISLNIINRWGGEVFNSTNYQNNWDAKGLSDGIYYYTSNYEGCEAVKGWVQVVR